MNVKWMNSNIWLLDNEENNIFLQSHVTDLIIKEIKLKIKVLVFLFLCWPTVKYENAKTAVRSHRQTQSHNDQKSWWATASLASLSYRDCLGTFCNWETRNPPAQASKKHLLRSGSHFLLIFHSRNRSADWRIATTIARNVAKSSSNLTATTTSMTSTTSMPPMTTTRRALLRTPLQDLIWRNFPSLIGSSVLFYIAFLSHCLIARVRLPRQLFLCFGYTTQP